jgi:hypothetical protein
MRARPAVGQILELTAVLGPVASEMRPFSDLVTANSQNRFLDNGAACAVAAIHRVSVVCHPI